MPLRLLSSLVLPHSVDTLARCSPLCRPLVRARSAPLAQRFIRCLDRLEVPMGGLVRVRRQGGALPRAAYFSHRSAGIDTQESARIGLGWQLRNSLGRLWSFRRSRCAPLDVAGSGWGGIGTSCVWLGCRCAVESRFQVERGMRLGDERHACAACDAALTDDSKLEIFAKYESCFALEMCVAIVDMID